MSWIQGCLKAKATLCLSSLSLRLSPSDSSIPHLIPSHPIIHFTSQVRRTPLQSSSRTYPARFCYNAIPSISINPIHTDHSQPNSKGTSKYLTKTYPVAFSNIPLALSVTFSLTLRDLAGSIFPWPNFFSAASRPVRSTCQLRGPNKR